MPRTPITSTRGARPVVARVVGPYLALNDAFLYYFYTAIQNFDVKILCARHVNVDVYPFEGLLPPAAPSRWKWLAHRVLTRLLPSALPRAFYGRSLREQGIQLLHADYGWTARLAYEMRRAFDLPLIVSFIGADASSYFESARHVADFRPIFEQAFAVTALSGVMRERLISVGCPAEKIRVIRLGVDLERFAYRPRKPVDDRDMRFLFVGRLVEKKAPNLAVKAFAKLLKAYPDAEFTLIGEGPLRADVTKLIARYGLGNRVHLLGGQPTSSVLREMYRSDVFVIPSVTAADGEQEGTPTVLLEAQATGMPVLSTYHAGIPEQVLHGRTGLLAEECHVAELARNMLWMAQNQPSWAAMGLAGHHHVREHYDIRKSVEKLESVYSEALAFQ